MTGDADGEARHKLGRACDAMADGNELLRMECDALETLIDGGSPDATALNQAHQRVRVAGMRSMGLTTAYLAELNTYMKDMAPPQAKPDSLPPKPEGAITAE